MFSSAVQKAMKAQQEDNDALSDDVGEPMAAAICFVSNMYLLALVLGNPSNEETDHEIIMALDDCAVKLCSIFTLLPEKYPPGAMEHAETARKLRRYLTRRVKVAAEAADEQNASTVEQHKTVQ